MPKIARKKKQSVDPNDQMEAVKAAILASTAAWFETFGSIQAKGGTILQFPDLKANWLQRKISDCISYCEQTKRACRMLVLKPRQKGCSTFSMAAFYRFLAKKRRRGGVIGGSHTQGSNLFKILRCYAENDDFAGDQKARVLEEKATFPNGSTAMQETASNPNAGRSGTYECLVATEVARWAEEGVSNAADVLAGILKCIPMLPGTLGILETTAAGAFGDFYDRWQRGITFEEFQQGKDGWVKIFAPWFVFEDSVRDPKLESIFSEADFSEKEVELAKQHDLSLEQVAWMRWAIREECKNDFDTFCQDYPFDDVSAFLMSGRKVFNVQGLKKMKDASELPQNQPEYGVLELSEDEQRVSFRPTEPNDCRWLIWEKPRHGCEYMFGVDLMTGATQVGSKFPDNHGPVVWRKGYFLKNKGWVPHRVVAHPIGDYAEWEKNLRFELIWDIDVLEEQVARASMWYGGCMIAPEINMDRGIVELLKQRGANIYQREIFNRREFTEDTALGWLTNQKTREMIIERWKTVIREHGRSFDGVDIHSPMLLAELESMVIKQNGRSEAKSGKKDDLVLGAGIGLVLIEKATTYKLPEHDRVLPPDLQQYLDSQTDTGVANQYS